MLFSTGSPLNKKLSWWDFLKWATTLIGLSCDCFNLVDCFSKQRFLWLITTLEPTFSWNIVIRSSNRWIPPIINFSTRLMNGCLIIDGELVVMMVWYKSGIVANSCKISILCQKRLLLLVMIMWPTKLLFAWSFHVLFIFEIWLRITIFLWVLQSGMRVVDRHLFY